MSFRFVSRAEWGARPPKSTSSIGTVKGIAVHWEGVAGKTNHPDCIAQLRSIQRFHMDTRGWSDIAYSWLVCNHGIIFEGRGWGIRTAANGVDYGNKHFHAVCCLAGPGYPVSGQGLLALGEVVRSAPGGGEVRPHSYFKATSCPGDQLRDWINAKSWQSSQPQPTQPKPPTKDLFEGGKVKRYGFSIQLDNQGNGFIDLPDNQTNDKVVNVTFHDPSPGYEPQSVEWKRSPNLKQVVIVKGKPAPTVNHFYVFVAE